MIDSHAHLTDKRLVNDLADVLQRARETGLTGILTIHCAGENEQTFLQLIEDNSFIHGAAGIHPGDIRKNVSIDVIKNLTKHPKVAAVGEIGLDYYYKDNPPRDTQISVFRMQLQYAREAGLPVIIHARDAWDDILQILQEENINNGVMHCFSGDELQMQECLALGLYISLAGTVTYPNAATTRRVAEQVPLDKLLIETDCPYLAPQQLRGKRNEPAYVRYTAEKIADIRKIDMEEVITATTKNTKELFGL